jgi:adenine-specific DNA glycosylase
VRRWCRALALRRVAEFPPVHARPSAVKVRRAVVLVGRRGRLLVERHEGPRLAGLWEPPGVVLAPRQSARRALAARLAELGLRARLAPAGAVVRHTITRHRVTVEVWRSEPAGAPPRSARLRWVDPRRPGVGLTALARKLAQRMAGPRPVR